MKFPMTRFFFLVVLVIIVALLLFLPKPTPKESYFASSSPTLLSGEISTPLYYYYDPNNPGGSNQSLLRMYYDSYQHFPTSVIANYLYTNEMAKPYLLFWSGLYDDGQASIGPGNDQYALYYRCGSLTEDELSQTPLSRVYPLNYVCYLSFNRDNPSDNKTYNGNDPEWSFSVQSKGVPNPFVPGNAATNSYGNSNSLKSHSPEPVEQTIVDPVVPLLPFQYQNSMTGQQGVFRLDRISSQVVTTHIDGGGQEPCLGTYLACPGEGAEFKQQNLTYGIMRIKVPNTYCPSLSSSSSSSTTTQPNVDVQYFSAGFHVAYNPYPDVSKLPAFWTVNGTMMREIMDADGYAHVFWIKDISTYNGEGFSIKQRTPPIIQWGKYKGYLMSAPTYAIIFRYKQANPNWIGNPAGTNTCCYPGPKVNQPISSSKLGGFCPEVFNITSDQSVQNFDGFMALDHIGAVTKDGPWPTSTINDKRC